MTASQMYNSKCPAAVCLRSPGVALFLAGWGVAENLQIGRGVWPLFLLENTAREKHWHQSIARVSSPDFDKD